MNKYWSNEDDNQVSYTNDRSAQESGRQQGSHRPAHGAAPKHDEGSVPKAFSAGRRLDRYDHNAQRSAVGKENDSKERSTFITEEMNKPYSQQGMQFAPPPKFSKPDAAKQQQPQPEYSDLYQGYQLQDDHRPVADEGKPKRRGWLILLSVVIAAAVLAGAAYMFRDQILNLAGEIFGEEFVWKIAPTPAPTTEPVQIPAYVESTPLHAKENALDEIEAITQGVNLTTGIITDENIVKLTQNQDGTSDYYLFAADDGKLLGYYEGLTAFRYCAENIFYLDQPPYLITSKGFPLVDLTAYSRSAGLNVTISSMVNGWALISDQQETTFNFIGENGELISNLWFTKTFPFTAETTLGYVDTGNMTDADTRYALYLLHQDGTTERLRYVADTNEVLESVCGMAFMQNGDMCLQDTVLTRVRNTDDVTAYVNCGALAVRDPETGLYGLFVDGIQQYPFSFDSIEPMASDLQCTEQTNGYVQKVAVTGYPYPLPRSYSFILKSGDTQQIVSIAAATEYPIVLH